jgi:autotransporter-associated beta strand protein
VAGVVTVNSNIAVNGIVFDLTGYTIAGDGTSAITLNGANPTISVVPSGSGTATITTQLSGAAPTITGGSANFLILNNTSANLNNFAGTLTIGNPGALRLGGGTVEQIPDDVDLNVQGVFDFVTSGTPNSNGKVERVHDITASGSANFSIGNGATIIARNISSSAPTSNGLSLNGNNAVYGSTAPFNIAMPARLNVEGDLTLASAAVRLTTTSQTGSTIGSILNVYGNIVSSGTSMVRHINATAPTTYRMFNFAGSGTHTHEINVTDGTLTVDSLNANAPVEITSTDPATQPSVAAGANSTPMVTTAIVNKTGAGEWIISPTASFSSNFSGTIDVQQGTLTLGASERITDTAALKVSGGTFNMQTFNETVGQVQLTGGTISGTGTATLTSANAFDLQAGSVSARLAGNVGLNKSGTGAVTLGGANTYTGATHVSAGRLIINGSLVGGAVTVDAGASVGGSGTIGGAINGAGTISPGNSPGITTAAGVNPAQGLDFSFELGQTGSPNYSSASASGNDVLRLTGASQFANALSAANGNVVDVYLNTNALPIGSIFRGGIYTDASTDFLNQIANATFHWFVQGDGHGVDTAFNGLSYYSLADFNSQLAITLGTQLDTANFGGGSVNGRVTTFTVSSVPEPAAAVLIAEAALAFVVIGRGSRQAFRKRATAICRQKCEPRI